MKPTVLLRPGRRVVVAAGLAGVLAAGTVACGSDSSGGGAAKELRVGVGVKILSVDPQGTQIGERTTLMVVQHIFDPLVGKGTDGPTPMLAEKWENPDPNTWKFTLRKGVKFQDGSELTSADVKASLDRMFQAKTPMSPLWTNVKSVDAPDAGTVTITTSKPTGALLTNLSLVYIASKAQIDSGKVATAPVGTGPFKLTEFKSGERTVLSANNSYWGDKPSLAKVEFKEIPEVSGRITALETKEIDVIYDIPPDQVKQVRGIDGVTVKNVPSLNYYLLWLNNEHKPLDDERVRKALWHAVNWQKIQKDLYGESATLAKAPVAQTAFGASTDLPPYEYDPKKAKQLLADAGYPNGFQTSIQWSSECCPNVRALTTTVISEWKKIGVTVKPMEKERGQWLDDLLALNWDMNIQDNAVITGDSEYVLGRLYTCAAKRLGYCSSEYDAAMDAAGQELDRDQREQKLQAAQKILWDDAPAIFPLDLTANAAWQSRVSGFEPAPNNIPDFRHVSVKN